MRNLKALTFATAIAFSTAAFAQEDTITVDLSGISDNVASELGLDVSELPTSIDLPAEIAAEVCGLDGDSLTDPCVATLSTSDLTAALEDEIETDEDENNSARAFAPGQQDGPAREFAPGQQERPAKDSAPGQVKKND